ncbi:hypothetical protein GCM10010246_67150 [Streptomyces cuspidosporus]|uniref:Uncharacterized protein n=1 Tax=Streptomyces cuspidosporus TaxID=66882 RepID=A0ABN3GZF7_9ACTN
MSPPSAPVGPLVAAGGAARPDGPSEEPPQAVSSATPAASTLAVITYLRTTTSVTGTGPGTAAAPVFPRLPPSDANLLLRR